MFSTNKISEERQNEDEDWQVQCHSKHQNRGFDGICEGRFQQVTGKGGRQK
jgi:hypothetical protein